MDRRKALMALGVAIVGIVSGKAKFVSGDDKTYVTQTIDTWWKARPTMILWKMDDTEVIKLQMGDETIEIKPSEIFEALKGGGETGNPKIK